MQSMPDSSRIGEVMIPLRILPACCSSLPRRSRQPSLRRADFVMIARRVPTAPRPAHAIFPQPVRPDDSGVHFVKSGAFCRRNDLTPRSSAIPKLHGRQTSGLRGQYSSRVRCNAENTQLEGLSTMSSHGWWVGELRSYGSRNSN